MNFFPNVTAALPEIYVAFMILVILLTDAFMVKSRLNFSLAQVTLIGALILQAWAYIHGGQGVQLTFNNMFILDPLAQGMKLFTYVIAIVSLIYIKQYLVDKKLLQGEFYAIFLFALLGMQVMISANNMLILYVGLELLSLALYGMVALQRDKIRATEAAMKFFILGALASGILLYGISFIYGASGGKLELLEIVKIMITSTGQNQALFTFGIVFIVAGLAFKLGLVPFHMWMPDVYEGSPLAVTTVIGTITKIAAVVFVIRFLIGGLILANQSWSIMLAILGILSVSLGNIIAISQTNMKRLLGYSAVAHMGFVAFALMTVTTSGLVAMIFYVLSYAITALAGFGALLLLSKGDYECEAINDLRGLNKSHPMYAGIIALVMFSMAGIPPFVGFYAKFKVLEALIDAGFIKTAVFAVIMSLIGAFYYIRVVKIMYFDDMPNDVNIDVTNNHTLVARGVLCVNALLVLVLGVMPNGLFEYCIRLISG